MGGTAGTCTVSGLGDISGARSPAGADPEMFTALYIQHWEGHILDKVKLQTTEQQQANNFRRAHFNIPKYRTCQRKRSISRSIRNTATNMHNKSRCKARAHLTNNI